MKNGYSDAEVESIFRNRHEAAYGYDPLDPEEKDYDTCVICGDEIESGYYCDKCKETIIDELRTMQEELKTDWATLWDAVDSLWDEAVEGVRK